MSSDQENRRPLEDLLDHSGSRTDTNGLRGLEFKKHQLEDFILSLDNKIARDCYESFAPRFEERVKDDLHAETNSIFPLEGQRLRARNDITYTLRDNWRHAMEDIDRRLESIYYVLAGLWDLFLIVKYAARLLLSLRGVNEEPHRLACLLLICDVFVPNLVEAIKKMGHWEGEAVSWDNDDIDLD
ncbi:hypothetical protein FPRO03_03445 [Fusarium proliferatum]|nr:hypothetical protein FPRO03_03445 [Fusarium proliferatum]